MVDEKEAIGHFFSYTIETRKKQAYDEKTLSGFAAEPETENGRGWFKSVLVAHIARHQADETPKHTHTETQNRPILAC